MSENLAILRKKLAHLVRMREDVLHSVSKLPAALEIIRDGDVGRLDADQREILSAFTTRFAVYQEHLGKAMRSIAIEEECPTSPFGSILALMERLGVLDDSQRWKDMRDLRNAASHDYEDDAGALCQILVAMRDGVPWLVTTHDKLAGFVARHYGGGRV